MSSRQLADGGRRLQETAVGWHVRHRNQFDGRIKHGGEGVQRDLAVLVVRYYFDCHAALADLQEGDDVAGIFGDRCQDAVSGRERDGIERHVPGPGSIFDQRDLGRAGVQQTRNRFIYTLKARIDGVFRLVAADFGFEVGMVDDGIDDGLWHQ